MTERLIPAGLALIVACAPVRRIPSPNRPPAITTMPVPQAQAQAHYLRGRLALLRGELIGASEAFALARVFDPVSADIPIAQGEVMLVGGDIDGARAHWAAATRLDPSSSRAWIHLARADRLMGDLSASADHYGAAIAAGHGWQARAGRVDVLDHLGDGPAAADELARWVAIADQDVMALGERGQRRLRHGDAAGARSDLEALALEHPGVMPMMVRWVEATRQSGLYGRTLEALEGMHSAAPSAEATLWAMSALGEAAGDAHQQADALESWLALEPDGRADLVTALAGARVGQGRPAEALRLLDGLPPAQRDAPSARWWAARAWLDRNRPAEAAQRLGSAPDDPNEVQRWAELNAAIDLVQGHEERARNRVTRDLDAAPAALAWAAVLRNEGRLDAATAWLHAKMEERPEDNSLRTAAADLATASWAPDRVMVLWEKWTRQQADQPLAARYMMAQAVWQVEGAQAAVGAMQAVHEEDPAHVGALIHLSQWTARTDVLGGLQMAQEAVDRAPADPAALSNLGWLSHGDGRNDVALRCLTKAVLLAPDDATITERLERVHSAVDGQ
jgi:tetratricopeptide (TPR) repeat protein